MKRKVSISLVAALASLLVNAQGQGADRGLEAITVDALVAQTGFLSSDWMEGRGTGERGAYLAADYIASMLQLQGLKPGGDMRFTYNRDGSVESEQSWYQHFSLVSTVPGKIQTLSTSTSVNGLTRRTEFSSGIDFIPGSPGGDITIDAPVVFVGYGIRDLKSGRDDFRGLDVRGKIILRISGTPSDVTDSSPYARYRAGIEKDVVARELGVAGILEADLSNRDGSAWTPEPVYPPAAPAESRVRSRSPRFRIPNTDAIDAIPQFTLSVKAANTILAGLGVDIDSFLGGKQVPAPKKGAPEVSVRMQTSVETTVHHVRNVIGVLEGKNPDQVIVLGAHYDHVGMSDGYIYNGADDNASGTVGVMTIARAFAQVGIKPEKTIIFALWTGEEKGLLGSRYFAANPTVPMENIILNINFDMISRYVADDRPNAVTMTYTASCPEFREMTLENLSKYGIELETDFQPSDDPPGGSDHRSFVEKGIPVMRFKPGHREEYHTPEDEISTLDWDIMQKIVRISFLNLFELSTTGWMPAGR